jgi:hypothetical protein
LRSAVMNDLDRDYFALLQLVTQVACRRRHCFVCLAMLLRTLH